MSREDGRKQFETEKKKKLDEILKFIFRYDYRALCAGLEQDLEQGLEQGFDKDKFFNWCKGEFEKLMPCDSCFGSILQDDHEYWTKNKNLLTLPQFPGHFSSQKEKDTLNIINSLMRKNGIMMDRQILHKYLSVNKDEKEFEKWFFENFNHLHKELAESLLRYVKICLDEYIEHKEFEINNYYYDEDEHSFVIYYQNVNGFSGQEKQENFEYDKIKEKYNALIFTETGFKRSEKEYKILGELEKKHYETKRDEKDEGKKGGVLMGIKQENFKENQDLHERVKTDVLQKNSLCEKVQITAAQVKMQNINPGKTPEEITIIGIYIAPSLSSDGYEKLFNSLHEVLKIAAKL